MRRSEPPPLLPAIPRRPLTLIELGQAMEPPITKQGADLMVRQCLVSFAAAWFRATGQSITTDRAERILLALGEMDRRHRHG